MTAAKIAATLLCVVAIAAGQLLFKRVSIEIEASGGWMHSRVLTLGLLACAVYGAATLMWIQLLRNAPLNQLYPFMALSFVLVPIASAWLFHEPLNLAYAIGTALIVAGVSVVTYYA